MKNILLSLLTILLISCSNNTKETSLAEEVKQETLCSWQSYKKYAWGHDVLKPISKSYHDWYEQSLAISPIDAYSTLKIMGFDEETKEIEEYVKNSINWDKDLYVKVFEVNIRIIGGLAAMYQYTKDPVILEKLHDFGKRILPAFDTPTGIPTYWVNLKTGETKGDTVNLAEAASYVVEFGMLSYYTKDPIFYETAKKATLACFERRSKLNLLGDNIDVKTGKWVSENSHIEAGADSYYEGLYKAYALFNDEEMKSIWNTCVKAIHKYVAEEYDNQVWYSIVNMHTGKRSLRSVTLYDAFFPALLALSGDIKRAGELQTTWDNLWNKYGLKPMIYNYQEEKPTYPVYELNPEIIESAYYLYHYTKDEKYLNMAKKYYADTKKYCRNEVAYASVENVETKEKRDYMPTFFFAETMKYYYLIFSSPDVFDFDGHIFNTEAHPYSIHQLDKMEIKKRLGIE